MRKKITSIALFALVSTIIIGSIPNYVYADTQSDSLIRIASQARDQVKIQLSKIDATQEIKEKFELGSEKIELLIEALKNDDIPTARKNFLSSMTIFNEIIQQISELSSTSKTASSSQTAIPSYVSSEIDRLERYIDQLKRIAIKNGFELDSTTADKLIEKARNEIKEENSDVTSTIEDIKQSIVDLNNSLKEKTRQYTTDRAVSLAEKHLEDLDKLIAEAKDIGVSQDTLDRLIDAKEQLNSVSDASNVRKIIDEVKKLLSVKKQFEDTKIQRIQVRTDQLESTYERLSTQIDNIPELEKAKEMLSELKVLISEKKINNAIQVLNSLNNLLNEIENSIKIEEEEIAESNEEQISSLADSKIERIKIKIERLEISLNNLNDEIGDNAAAKRWLNNAFSLLQDAKNQVDNSADNALDLIMSIEQIIKRIQNTIQ
jgi:DNA repair exonuclease SbcCD ATPase subunit